MSGGGGGGVGGVGSLVAASLVIIIIITFIYTQLEQSGKIYNIPKKLKTYRINGNSIYKDEC